MSEKEKCDMFFWNNPNGGLVFDKEKYDRLTTELQDEAYQRGKLDAKLNMKNDNDG